MAPSDVRQIGTVTKYELIKYLRGRRLLAIVLLTVIISAIFLAAPPAAGSQYSKDPTDFITNVFQFFVGAIAKFKPWFSITFANGISQFILQNRYPTDKVVNATAPLGSSAGVGGPQAFSLAYYYPDVRLSLAVMAAYFIVAFLSATCLPDGGRCKCRGKRVEQGFEKT